MCSSCSRCLDFDKEQGFQLEFFFAWSVFVLRFLSFKRGLPRQDLFTRHRPGDPNVGHPLVLGRRAAFGTTPLGVRRHEGLEDRRWSLSHKRFLKGFNNYYPIMYYTVDCRYDRSYRIT